MKVWPNFRGCKKNREKDISDILWGSTKELKEYSLVFDLFFIILNPAIEGIMIFGIFLELDSRRYFYRF